MAVEREGRYQITLHSCIKPKMFPYHRCRHLIVMASQRSVTRVGVASCRSVSRPFSSATSDSSSAAMKDQKRMLAEASLKQVPHHGWTQDAITAAVLEHPQMTISMSGLLTPIELVNWIMEDWNDQMRQKKKNKKDLNLFDAIEWRLKQVIPLVQTGKWHQGMALGLSTPLTTRSQLHEFIDIIALPNSTTIYKTALCGVFVSTELFLLTDSSPDYRETWKFLEGRLQELESGKFLNLLDTTSIPMAATSAVASSLLEGVASLLMPSFFSNSNGTSGTKESDYKPTSSQR